MTLIAGHRRHPDPHAAPRQPRPTGPDPDPRLALALGAAPIAGFTYSQLWLVDSTPGTHRSDGPTVNAAVGLGTVLIVAANLLALPTLRPAVDRRGLRTA
jgi:hypothetical protein